MFKENNSDKNTVQVEGGNGSAPAVVVIKERSRGSLRWKITLFVALFIVVAGVVIGLMVGGQVKAWITPPDPPITVINELTDEDMATILKGKSLQIQNIVLGEARERGELLVLEQDVSVTNLWESAWGNLEIFRKSKEVTSFGTGYYTVDLAPLAADAIVVDHTYQTVTITVPNATLKSISVDEERTEFGETQHGLLSFGEIKLTLEQRSLLQAAVEENMRGHLNQKEVLVKADNLAVEKVKEVYQPLISAMGDYTVIVILDGEPGAGAQPTAESK